jgi:hypothetical protein
MTITDRRLRDFLKDRKERSSWSFVLCDSTSIVIIKTWSLLSRFGQIVMRTFFSWIEWRTFGLRKIKTGAYPIPTIWNWTFVFFEGYSNFAKTGPVVSEIETRLSALRADSRLITKYNCGLFTNFSSQLQSYEALRRTFSMSPNP